MMIYLHIGLNKTGTSSLQVFLASNREALLRQGYCYPIVDDNHVTQHCFVRDIGLLRSDDLCRRYPQVVDAMDAGRHVILSSESFHDRFDISDFFSFFGRKRVRVVVYLRSHFDYLFSWYREGVKSKGISMKFAEFLGVVYVNYTRLLSRWTSYFGPENVVIRIYDRARLKKQSITFDFCSLLPGLDHALLDFSIPHHNPSLSGNLLVFKLLLNKHLNEEQSYKYAYEFEAIAGAFEAFHGPVLVDDGVISHVEDVYRDDRYYVEKIFNAVVPVSQRSAGGNLSPNLETLWSDFECITDFARDNNFGCHDLLRLIEHDVRDVTKVSNIVF